MADEYSNDDGDPAAIIERCAHPQGGGAMCGEPVDLHCPICRVPLCYACAAEHCTRAAPMCNASASASPASQA